MELPWNILSNNLAVQMCAFVITTNFKSTEKVLELLRLFQNSEK